MPRQPVKLTAVLDNGRQRVDVAVRDLSAKVSLKKEFELSVPSLLRVLPSKRRLNLTRTRAGSARPTSPLRFTSRCPVRPPQPLPSSHNPQRGHPLLPLPRARLSERSDSSRRRRRRRLRQRVRRRRLRLRRTPSGIMSRPTASSRRVVCPLPTKRVSAGSRNRACSSPSDPRSRRRRERALVPWSSTCFSSRL